MTLNTTPSFFYPDVRLRGLLRLLLGNADRSALLFIGWLRIPGLPRVAGCCSRLLVFTVALVAAFIGLHVTTHAGSFAMPPVTEAPRRISYVILAVVAHVIWFGTRPRA